VATGFGVSDASYKSTTDKLLYGIGQGSCSSPIVWALLNQLLLTALGEEFDYILLVSSPITFPIAPPPNFLTFLFVTQHHTKHTRCASAPFSSFITQHTSPYKTYHCCMKYAAAPFPTISCGNLIYYFFTINVPSLPSGIFW
jgi:hypothetical protein